MDQRTSKPSFKARRVQSILRELLGSEASGGIVLMVAAALALVVANTQAAPIYFASLETSVLGLSVLHWINDALMALFFLLVGLEIKREMLVGQLSTWPRRALPGVAAAGGMIVPALVYAALNWSSPETIRGWAIPAATDIAFALGIAALLGPRVGVSLKLFLMALAILDDIGAIAIIAVFYTADLSLPFLALSGAATVLLAVLNRSGVNRLWPYLLVGAILWVFVLKSGVHATLAGVILAFCVPLDRAATRAVPRTCVLMRLEHGLQPWVAFAIVPLFGFANAGLPLAGMSKSALIEPVPLGIALGLFLGKQIGVFTFAWAAIRLGFAELPRRASWAQLYGVGVLCGIGFTMSLFIGMLAFSASPELQDRVKLGVLVGSLASALVGAALLRVAPPRALLGRARSEAADRPKTRRAA